MSRRYRCLACRTAFVSENAAYSRPVSCPKCGAEKATAAPEVPATASPPDASVFVPADDPPLSRRRRRLVWASLGLLAMLGVVAAVAWPTLRDRWKPAPRDPVESVATAYLRALTDGDHEAAARLGTVDLPPAIRTFRRVRHDPTRDERWKGSFAPITAFHARLNESFTYDPATGRFTPRNLLGPLAETLDTLHAAQEKAETEGLYKKMQSGDPNDIFDAAEGLARPMAALAKGALSPKKLIPSYQQLVEDAAPLPPAERSLALDQAEHRESWQALLKRPFVTLKADGPFVLDRAEVTASAVDALGSLGDPPTTLRLTLTRFRLEGIDTGWKVTAARRETSPTDPPPSETSPPSSPGSPSPH